jgi:hypothetical protein
MKNRKNNKLILGAIAVIAFLGLAYFLSQSSNSPSVASSRISANNQPAATKATASVNKQFDFHAINQKKESKEITFSITTVDRKDEIKVKDATRKASIGKDYILVRLEMDNKNSERLALAPSDFIRLEVDGKLFAPDYHNGNVILDPLSVKRDIVSFVVPKDIKQFTFQVGELSGKKEKIEISF